MKITKTKEIEKVKVTESIIVEPGTYYFEDEHHFL